MIVSILAAVAFQPSIVTLPALSASATHRAPAEKMICRVSPKLGSRTEYIRSCRTDREWDDIKQQTMLIVGRILDGH